MAYPIFLPFLPCSFRLSTFPFPLSLFALFPLPFFPLSPLPFPLSPFPFPSLPFPLPFFPDSILASAGPSFLRAFFSFVHLGYVEFMKSTSTILVHYRNVEEVMCLLQKPSKLEGLCCEYRGNSGLCRRNQETATIKEN